jgi:SAM-dependent methyltransferase
MLEDSQIRDAYLGLLGRHPESNEVINQKRQQFNDYSDLLQDFIKSDEFVETFAAANSRRIRGSMLVNKVQTEVDKPTLQLLFQRTIRQCTHLGDVEPYWSVLSSAKFEVETFEQHSEEFWSSGSKILELIDRIEYEFNLDFSDGSILELGCGVGRMTWFLASRARHVIGVDISAGNLAIAQSRVSDQADRCELVLLADFEQLKGPPKLDLFLSFIALQHNSPPVQSQILKSCLAQLKLGGVAVFQVVVGSAGYEFESDRYLASVENQMEMHCLPLTEILKIFANVGIAVSSIEPDDWASDFGLSMTVIGQRVR